MNKDTAHHREGDNGRENSLHRRSTDTGFSGWIRRNLGWLSYLLLAAAIAFSLGTVRDEGIERRTEIVQATQKVIFDSCKRGNDTRALLRGLIHEGQTADKKYLEEGLFTQPQYERAIAANKEAIAKLADVDCEAAIQRVAAQQGNG